MEGIASARPTCGGFRSGAEATILGDVTIGKGSIIGGNVWVKESVPAGVTVSTPNAELVFKKNAKS